MKDYEDKHFYFLICELMNRTIRPGTCMKVRKNNFDIMLTSKTRSDIAKLIENYEKLTLVMSGLVTIVPLLLSTK